MMAQFCNRESIGSPRFAIVAVAVLCATGLIACDRGDASPLTGDAPTTSKTSDGVVRGIVKLDGVPPKLPIIASDPCDGGAEPVEQETVIVNANGALQNVLVSVEGMGSADGSGREPALLDQVECRYVPHVLGVQVGQTLRLRSSDSRVHNAHYTPAANAHGNYTFTSAGEERETVFTTPEVVRIKCDIHPWMTAYVGVFDNSFFAVTGDDGTFEIKGLPTGKYTLVAWHERYGRLEQPLTIAVETKPVDATFKYAP